MASRDMEDGSIETKALKSDLADLKAKAPSGLLCGSFGVISDRFGSM